MFVFFYENWLFSLIAMATVCFYLLIMGKMDKNALTAKQL